MKLQLNTCITYIKKNVTFWLIILLVYTSYFMILTLWLSSFLCVSFYSTFLEAAECARSHEEILTLR